MEENIERCFFEPDFEGKSLTVYELRGWPSLMAGKINLCYDDNDTLLLLEKIPPDAFLDKSALKSVQTEGLGLFQSVDNYDRMTLLHIMDKGYPRDGLMDEYPDNFSFYEKFERIERALLGRNRWNVYDEMQDRAKKLVGKLLREQFSDTRQKVEIKEKVVLRNSKSIRI